MGKSCLPQIQEAHLEHCAKYRELMTSIHTKIGYSILTHARQGQLLFHSMFHMCTPQDVHKALVAKH